MNGNRGSLGRWGAMLTSHGVTLGDEDILELFAKLESRIEAGTFYNYKTGLARVAEGFGEELGFIPHRSEIESFSRSVEGWPPVPGFPDTFYNTKKCSEKRYNCYIVCPSLLLYMARLLHNQ